MLVTCFPEAPLFLPVDAVWNFGLAVWPAMLCSHQLLYVTEKEPECCQDCCLLPATHSHGSAPLSSSWVPCSSSVRMGSRAGGAVPWVPWCCCCVLGCRMSVLEELGTQGCVDVSLPWKRCGEAQLHFYCLRLDRGPRVPLMGWLMLMRCCLNRDAYEIVPITPALVTWEGF